MNLIDYSQSIYYFVGKRKHFFKNVQYHIYIFDDFLVMGQQANDPKPKYRIQFSLQVQIQFQLDKDYKSDIRLVAFSFKYKTQYKDMFASHVDIAKMKNKISNKVTFFKIADFYDPQSVIGKGSSARVLLVQKLFDNEKFAVKSIDKAYLFKSDTGLEAFQSEVKILTLLSQTNTEQSKLFLKLFEIFEGDLTYYLIVELMKGNTLQDELDALKSQKDGPSIMTPLQTLTIMQKLIEGVSLMHQNNIIHRDLKPDNIMFALPGNYQTLRIVDFGLATETSVEKYLFPKCGTPGYVAPEVLNLNNRTEKYGSICDLFSCGCIFFKLLTGRSLFQGTQFNEVLKLNKACDVDLVTNIDLININPDAYNLLTQLLQKDPKRRINAEDALKHPYLQDTQKVVEIQFSNIVSWTKLSTADKTDMNRRQEKNHDNEDVFSPFQKRAMQNKVPLQLYNVQEDHKAEEDSNREENLSDKVMQEFQFHEGLSIQQMPCFKRPGVNLNVHSCLRMDESIKEHQKRSKSAHQQALQEEEEDKFQQFENLAPLKLSNKISTLSPMNRQSINPNSVNSFYMKDPLSILKKHNYKKDSKNSFMFQSQETPYEDPDKQFMGKLSLFNRAQQDPLSQSDKQ